MAVGSLKNSRKTIDVDFVREKANAYFRSPGPISRDGRFGVAALLDSILLESGNYKGFRFLTKDQVPYMAEPGIDESGVVQDGSRRFYF